MNPVGLLLVLASLFSICGGLFNWEFFFASSKAQIPQMLLGRNGARIFYIVMGLAISTMGTLLFLGVLK